MLFRSFYYLLFPSHDTLDKEEQYKNTKDDNIFWDTYENIDKQSYYFANLCSWSANLHKPYGEYIKQLKEKEDNKNNIYSGIGEDVNDDLDNDLAWLNML